MATVDADDGLLTGRGDSRLRARKVDIGDCTLRSRCPKVFRVALGDQEAVLIIRRYAVA